MSDVSGLGGRVEAVWRPCGGRVGAVSGAVGAWGQAVTFVP